MTPVHLFVYGTLLASSGHRLGDMLAASSARLGAGSIQARLYVISEVDDQGENSYPAALPSPRAADRVHGEVFALRDPVPLLAEFDKHEACSPEWPEPHEFLLRNVPVRMADGREIWAKSYLYAWDPSGARHIPSGRFTERMPQAR